MQQLGITSEISNGRPGEHAKEINIQSISIKPDMCTEAIAGKFIFIMYISQIFNKE